ncbi:MAG: hypothetical protein NW226_19160 [Microscillaceae bacterium]|nr:hypothetical protein [Microscillaceae bacterium]
MITHLQFNTRENFKIFTILLVFFLNIHTNLFAQKLDMEKFKGMKPRAIGPAGMSGRITAIDAQVSNPQVIYAGAASGGLWKTEDGGISWKPIFEKEKVAAIGAIAINQNHPDIVWAGTGEGNPRNSHTGGYGIYKSLDAGKTWKCMGLEKTKNIHRIIVSKDNPDVVYVAAIGSPWGAHAERGVFKTTDGGKTWKNVLFTNSQSGTADMVVDPQNPNKILVAMWEHKRDPWFFKSGGEGSGLYLTYDGGESWKKLSSKEGLPEGELGRMGLAFAPSNPKIVYAIIESKKNAIYKSVNGGENWSKVTDNGRFGDRPFYYSEIYVDPKNENRLYSLFTYVSKSEDGGKTWNVIADYGNGVHPDHHAFWIDPNDPDFLIDGNDGGLFISRDQGKNWRFAENIPVGQFYHVNVDLETPYNVYGGMQDNGSWRGPAYVWRTKGIRNSYWDEIMFGDGFDAVPDPKNPRYAYGMSQQGNVGRIDLQTGLTRAIQPVHPDGVYLRYNWNSAIAVDPIDNKTVYFGSQFVHKSTDYGNNWEIISPDLTTNDPSKQKQTESGGLTYDATGAENHTTILAISPSPVQEGVIWVGTDDGNLQLTQDGGKTWTNLIKNIKGVPANSWIPQIKASNKNAGEALVVINNYRRDDMTPYVFQTKDFGKTWKRIADESKVWGYALAIVQDPIEPKLMFLGTEFGLYVSIDEGNTWTQWTNEYPTVSTMDLVIHPREHDLVIGTFGRAIYVLDDIRPLRDLAQKGAGLLDQPVKVYSTPDAVLANYQEAAGIRFSAQGIYEGQNRPFGAMISYSVKEVKMKSPPKTDSTTSQTSTPTRPRSGTMVYEVKEDIKSETPKDTLKITIEILNEQSKVIRTIKATPQPGINRVQWDLNRKGLRMPNARRPQNPDAPEPAGPQILPGDYMIRITYGQDKDSTKIKVIPDPRTPIPLADMQAKNAMIEQMMKKIELSTQAAERLDEANETTQIILKQLEGNDEKTKELKKLGKTIQDTIKVLLESIRGKEGLQGIQRNPNTLSAKIGDAFYTLQDSWNAPDQGQTRLVAQAEKAVVETLEKVNRFIENDWANFKKKVEENKFSLFKEYKPLKTE